VDEKLLLKTLMNDYWCDFDALMDAKNFCVMCAFDYSSALRALCHSKVSLWLVVLASLLFNAVAI
jgi:hypothetical protein